jgi:GntR family transcriptional regulator
MKARVTHLNGPSPAYVLLYEEVLSLIRSGALAPHEQLPSERELCIKYGVSRTTVRQALNRAERHGFIVRVAGRGNFVTQPHLHAELPHMLTFQRAMLKHSMTPVRRVLSMTWQPGAPSIAERLAVEARTPLLHVVTLTLDGNRPMAWHESFLPPPIGTDVEGVLTGADDDPRPTYEIAAHCLGVQTLLADETFEAVELDEPRAAVLALRVGAPAFRVSGVFKTPDGLAIESLVAIFPGLRYSFHITRDLDLGEL